MDEAWRPSAGLGVLRRRAELLSRTRAFFADRGVLEVEVPLLQSGANLDRGVEPFALDGRFLITSPEHPLKRLVAAGAGDVWTLTNVFRRGELGRLHAPEFRMLEWYRLGIDERALAAECVALCRELTGMGGDVETLAYDAVFARHLGVDPRACTVAELEARLDDDAGAIRGDPAAALDLAFATRVQPTLGRGRWTVVVDWPPEQAAQARLRRQPDGASTAARFEIFRDGIELANGYWELADADELAERLRTELATRDGDLRRDANFEDAMRAGMPDCAGVAVGFDRLVMLACGAQHIREVQAFGWERS